MYFTDRGIEELDARRGDESVTLAWVAERLRTFVDLNPELETPIAQPGLRSPQSPDLEEAFLALTSNTGPKEPQR